MTTTHGCSRSDEVGRVRLNAPAARKGPGSGRLHGACIAVALAANLVAGARADDLTLSLAKELSFQQDHAGAAIEFRRLALDANDASARAAYFWSAAWEYAEAGDLTRAEAMLDRAEEAAPDWSATANLLRGDVALRDRRPAEAAFFFESALAVAAEEDRRVLASRRLAEARLREGRVDDARAVLAGAPGDTTAARQALRDYEAGSDKSPRLGGWLGIVPGMGYAYAGEYANAARSIILNGLFLWGMSNTAEDEDWGAFAVITFFEFTWYSGSIYGGIDASHRHNRARLQRAAEQISGGVSYTPDYDRLPALHLRFRF